MNAFWKVATICVFVIIIIKGGAFLSAGTGIGSGSASVSSASWMPKSEVPTSHNGVSVVGAFEKGGIEKAIGAK